MKFQTFANSLSCLILLAAVALAQVPPPPSPSPTADSKTPTGKRGAITGRVVGEDGQPLEGATVLVTTMGGNRDTNRSGATDEEGNFKLQNLPAAAYIVMASVPGYVSPQGSMLDLMTIHTAQRHRLGDNLTLTLVKGGVITGKVLDASGQPLVGAPVIVSRVRDAEGRPINESILTGRPGQTDDRGVYRLYGLQAGSYVVYTSGAGEQFSLLTGAREVPTYYPTSTRDTAQEVIVAAGGEVRGIDIRHRGEPGHAVSGTVVGAADAGTGQGQIGVELLLAGTNNRAGMAVNMTSNSGFALYGVPDGEYDLTAIQRIINREPRITMDSLVSAPRRVTVRGGDVTGIELRLVALSSIAGRVVIEKLEKTDCSITRRGDLEELLLLPRREDKEMRRGSLAFFSQDVTPNEQGEFMVRELEAGRYRLTTQLPSDHWYIKAMTLPTSAPSRPAPARTAAKPAAPSFAASGLTLKSGEKLSGVTITLAEGAAGLSGRLEGKKPAARMRVFLVPAEKEAADDVLRYYEFVTRDGAFSFTNLAPGKYWLHARAVPDDESDEKPAKPVAWEASERAKLRRDTEAEKNEVTLTNCQRVKEFILKFGAAVK